MKKQFTTENFNPARRTHRHETVSGPFAAWRESWAFTALSDNACKVELSLRYQFASTLLRKRSPARRFMTSRTLVDAFVRARTRNSAAREPVQDRRESLCASDRQVLRRILLPDGSTVEDAIPGERPARAFPEMDTTRVGIHGEPVPVTTVLRDRDRVEIYRPLRADPKESQANARAKKRAKG